MTPSLEFELRRSVERLSPENVQRVIDFAKSLESNLMKGARGSDLLPFAGTISHEDAEMMRAAIEEGCEQVNPDDWKDIA